MSIRNAAATDLDAMMDLYVRGWQSSYANIVNSNFLADMGSSPRSRDYMQGLLAGTRADAVVLLAEDAAPVGFIAAGMSRDVIDRELAEIYAVYIDAVHQGRQLGRRLFDECVKQLQNKGFQRLHVWTFAANKPAQQAYASWGGKLNGASRTVAVGGDHLEEVSFSWDL